jgi:hypothetical protein
VEVNIVFTQRVQVDGSKLRFHVLEGIRQDLHHLLPRHFPVTVLIRELTKQ